jgi:hypothetical protein
VISPCMICAVTIFNPVYCQQYTRMCQNCDNTVKFIVYVPYIYYNIRTNTTVTNKKAKSGDQK